MMTLSNWPGKPETLYVWFVDPTDGVVLRFGIGKIYWADDMLS
jgi:hypothetical protein